MSPQENPPLASEYSPPIEQIERELEQVSAQRRRVFPRAALVGLLVGLLAVAFRITLDLGQTARLELVNYAHHFGAFGALLPALVCAFVAALGVYVVQKLAPEASGSGIPHLQAVLHGWKTLRAGRVMLIKFVGGALAIGSGLGLGREGPTVQMGGSIAQIVARRTNALPDETRALMAAGAGAGLAAAFNAPLAGMIFVLEEIQRDFSPLVFSAAFVACIVGDVVSRVLVGPEPAFHVLSPVAPQNLSLPLFAVLGAVAGLLGVVFNRALMGTLAFVDNRPSWKCPRGLTMLGAMVGFVAGAVGFWLPSWVGSGHGLAEVALDARLLLGVIPLLFLFRFLLSIGSYATGAAGGVFAPLLALGALIGLCFALSVAHFLPPGLVDPRTFAIVGMAAYFTAVVRAPLTGIVLIAEMTGGYVLLLPLLTACFMAYGVAEWMRDLPLYEALLERSMGKSPSAALHHPR